MSAEIERLKLVVPIDYSASSRRALAWAFDYAARVPCETHVLHVIEAPDGASQSEVMQEVEAVTHEAEFVLFEMLRTPEERRAVLPLHRDLVLGRRAEAILRFARQIGAETIVMGHGDHHGLHGSSIIDAVMRGAHCPVVCVKPAKAA